MLISVISQLSNKLKHEYSTILLLRFIELNILKYKLKRNALHHLTYEFLVCILHHFIIIHHYSDALT